MKNRIPYNEADKLFKDGTLTLNAGDGKPPMKHYDSIEILGHDNTHTHTVSFMDKDGEYLYDDACVIKGDIGVDALMKQIQEDTPSPLYIRTQEGITPIASWEEFEKVWEARYLEEDTIRIGYSDYSIEFDYCGSFLYPVDRDFPTDDMYRKVSAEDTYDYLSSFGAQADDFLRRLLPSGASISDSFNHADFSVEEVYAVVPIDVFGQHHSELKQNTVADDKVVAEAIARNKDKCEKAKENKPHTNVQNNN